MHNQTKRAAPGRTRPNGTTNDRNNTGCRCAAQLHFDGFPPPPLPGEGPLADYLEAIGGWLDRMDACAALSISDRDARAQSENSGGRIIFGSGRGQGLKHIRHADAWEVRRCAAELRGRGASHYRRAAEIENAWREMGGAL